MKGLNILAREEGTTDLWVNHLLEQANIKLDYQSSRIKGIDEALHTGSKKLNDKPGYPEYVGTVKDFLLVIEDKSSIDNHVHTVDDVIDTDNSKIVPEYALNGALHYARHILERTSYKKCFAFGVSGHEKIHRITPLYVNERGDYTVLSDVESFISFNERNIDEYYMKEVLNEETNEEKTTADILKDAAQLHADLRTYGQLKDTDKPLVVSGILLALREGESHNFSIDSLNGDTVKTDGKKIMEAIDSNLRRSNVAPQEKRDKLLNQFSIITDSAKLNIKDERLGMTPLRYYTEYINRTIYQDIKYTDSSEDYLGRFYGEFMSYSGGDGQSLGIILTPKHITQLFCDLVDLKPDDHVFDPTCGTGGFLIAAMHNMLKQTNDVEQQRNIRKNQLYGIELQDYMFTIATTNMILRGDGKSNLKNEDFLVQPSAKLQTETMATVGMMNPPYSQGSKEDPTQYELNFILHLLDSLLPDGRCVVIVPQSSMIGKSGPEKEFKRQILKEHTLEGVITCNPNTFYGVGTNPVIAVFTAHEPHPIDKKVKFIDFRNDGYVVKQHVGLAATSSIKERKDYLLQVWNKKITAPASFFVESVVKPDDEWLHSFYSFNDKIPNDDEFEKTVSDYLSYQFSTLMQNRNGLTSKINYNVLEHEALESLDKKEWKVFPFTDIFDVKKGFYNKKPEDNGNGTIPFLGATDSNNGVTRFLTLDEIKRSTKTGRLPNSDLSKKLFSGHAIAVTNNGSVGHAYYQDTEFTCSHDINPLYLKDHQMNVFEALFLIKVIEQQGKLFQYARKWRPSRMVKSKLMLPVTENGVPDFKYMEQYIKNILINKYQKYIKFING